VVNVTNRPLFFREIDPVPILQEAAWAQGPVWKDVKNVVANWTLFREKCFCAEAVFDMN
jgi:hypothetical protein